MKAVRLGLAFAMLCALALHGWSMGPQNLPHLLWSCHLASFVLAVGLLLNQRLLVSAGLLFHLGLGFPLWLVEIVATRGTFGAPMVTPRVLATSILVHSLPLIAGAFYVRRSLLPASSALLAWLFQVGMLPLSRWLTPPEFNVNLAHAVWKPLANTFTNFWFFQFAGALAALIWLVLVRLAWNAYIADKPQALSRSSLRRD
jgi:hypothetical protein